MSKFYDDTMKGLLQAIVLEKGFDKALKETLDEISEELGEQYMKEAEELNKKDICSE